MTSFDPNAIDIDPESESRRIEGLIKRDVTRRFRRKGAVVGISGGVDSSVVLALCARALGPERVLGVLMPERESSDDSRRLALEVAEQYAVETVLEDVTPALEGLRTYERRDEAVARVFPDFRRGRDRIKLTLPGNVLAKGTLNVFSLTKVDERNNEESARLKPDDLDQIVAASNFKQRTRMALLYYHAERRRYVVVGTPNKDEHDQGFFVKWGDGGYDIGPIRHLFKTQVYQLAEYLEIPREIREAIPTTDTYSAPSSQEEFFFRMPFEVMDRLWFAFENGVAAEEAAAVLGMDAESVERAYANLAQKISATEYLRTPPIEYGEAE